MNEIDRIGARAADEVRARAAAIADTDRRLVEANQGTRRAVEIVANETSHRVPWRLVVGVAAVATLGGVALVVRQREPDRVVSPPPVTADATVPAPSSTSTALTTTTVATTVPLLSGGAALEHGLSVGFLPVEAGSIRNVEAMRSGVGRADYVAEIRLVGGGGIRVTLSDELINSEGADANGENNLKEVIVHQTPSGAWLRLEIFHDFDRRTGAQVPAAVSFDDLREVVASVAYNPSEDHRTTAMADEQQFSPGQCTDEVSVGGGGPDMVLFTCDGKLAIYSGSKGQQIELIQQFDDPRVASSGEGSGPPFVDGIAVSPDGSTLYFSTGPEPIAGNLYRYVVGSGVAPEFIGYGFAPAVSPDGTRVAVVYPDGIGVSPAAGGDGALGFSLYGMFAGDLSWAPDGQRIAFATAGGVIGVIEVATGDITLYANTQQGMRYFEPWFDRDRGLMALGACCAGADGDGVEFVVVGGQGNSVPPEATGDGSLTPLSFVRSHSGAAAPFVADRLGPPDQPWATGVLEAALFPSPA
jgi:WD40 repeat protein